jgi:hypothetical protein
MGLAFKAKIPARGQPLSEAHLFEWLDDMAASGARPNNTVWSAHNNPMTQQMCCWADDGTRHATLIGLCEGGVVTDEVLHCAVKHLVSDRNHDDRTQLQLASSSAILACHNCPRAVM